MDDWGKVSRCQVILCQVRKQKTRNKKQETRNKKQETRNKTKNKRKGGKLIFFDHQVGESQFTRGYCQQHKEGADDGRAETPQAGGADDEGL